MFIARKNIAARLLGFPGRILVGVRNFFYEEKTRYCELVLKPRIEKASLIRRSAGSDQLAETADFKTIVSALELAVYNNTADAPLAAEILRDIARREAQFQEEHHDRAASMLSGYQKKIIKEILLAGYRAEERIKQLSNRAALHLAAER